MPLPGFREDGWLPDGHHPVTWEEIVLRFRGPAESRRAQMLENLLRWRARLTAKGITGRLLLNGSFISAHVASERRRGGDAVITDDEQLEIALLQLAGFKDMLRAMQVHLSESEPTLIPTVSEGYQHRILELQDEICDYLLRQRGGERKPLMATPG